MARRRMLSRSLGTSRKFAELQVHGNGIADFAQTLYQLLVVASDDWGRMPADAFTVKHSVFPTSPHPIDHFAEALQVMHKTGLVVLYKVDNCELLQIVDFDRHQPGLNKRTKADLPEIPRTSRKS